VQILTVNAGSSSLKLRLLNDADEAIGNKDFSIGEAGIDTDELDKTLRDWPEPDAIGHRIVHGGRRFTAAVRVNAEVEQALRKLTDLAPLHQPKSLAAYDAVTKLLPDVPAAACFDTAFHASLPDAAATYAVPGQWRQRYGVRRYGFHGLSHAYAAQRAAELLARPLEQLRIVVCHLGAGASLAAIVHGRSIDTTMGFTPLEGLVMATRSGSVDPALVLWLQQHAHLPPEKISAALEQQSGLLGLAGTANMQEIETRAAKGDTAAKLAFDVFTHSLITNIGAMTAAAGGLDALVFTGGIGKRSPQVRRAACKQLGHLNVLIDSDANERVQGDTDISHGEAGARTLVVAAREDIQIARETRLQLGN
jgi:acetate kinase